MAGNVHNLRPAWPPGRSGNPSGNNMTPEVRKQLVEARKLCAENAQAAIRVYLEVMANGSEAGKLKAASEVLDRAGLKAVAVDVQTTETDENGDSRTFRVEFVKPE